MLRHYQNLHESRASAHRNGAAPEKDALIYAIEIMLENTIPCRLSKKARVSPIPFKAQRSLIEYDKCPLHRTTSLLGNHAVGEISARIRQCKTCLHRDRLAPSVSCFVQLAPRACSPGLSHWRSESGRRPSVLRSKRVCLFSTPSEHACLREGTINQRGSQECSLRKADAATWRVILPAIFCSGAWAEIRIWPPPENAAKQSLTNDLLRVGAYHA